MEKEYVYKCKTHGQMTLEQVGIYKDSESKKGFRYRCKACMHETRIQRYYKDQAENIRKSVEWKKANRDHVNDWNREDKLANPEKYKLWRDAYYTRNSEDICDRGVSRRRGINLEDYHAMVKEQDNKCAICRFPEKRMMNGKIVRLCMDHNHATGRIRELLCHDCNTAIGKMKDDVQRLQLAIDYLNKHNKAE